jgi:methionyl-tRNA synthetase
MQMGDCPVCQGKLEEADGFWKCEGCGAEVWPNEENIQEQPIVRTAKNKFFFLPHNPKEVLPLFPEPKKRGGSRGGRKRDKKKGTKKYIEPWKLE